MLLLRLLLLDQWPTHQSPPTDCCSSGSEGRRTAIELLNDKTHPSFFSFILDKKKITKETINIWDQFIYFWLPSFPIHWKKKKKEFKCCLGSVDCCFGKLKRKWRHWIFRLLLGSDTSSLAWGKSSISFPVVLFYGKHGKVLHTRINITRNVGFDDGL